MQAAEPPPPPPNPPRRKRRWGDDGGGPIDGNSNNTNDDVDDETTKRKSRFSSVPPENNGNGNVVAPPPQPSTATDPKARAAALQASIQARLAALKARTGVGVPSSSVAVASRPKETPSNNNNNNNNKPTATAATTTTTTHKKRPLDPTTTATINNDSTENNKSKKRARVFELDMSTTVPTRLVEKQKREEELRSKNETNVIINPYLAHHATIIDKQETNVAASARGDKKTLVREAKKKGELKTAKKLQQQQQTEDEDIILDTRLASQQSKLRTKSRPINFVAPGTYIALGEKKRLQASLAAQSGFISGRKVGNVVKSVGMGGGVDDHDGLGITNNFDGKMTTTNNNNYYGSSNSTKSQIDNRLPSRVDAPEIQLEDYVTKKKILTSISDVDATKNDGAILSALNAAASSMPYAMEWWDAELLPTKLKKELAGEEGKAIVSRAKKQLGKKNDDNANDKAKQQQHSSGTVDEKAGGEENTISNQYQTQNATHAQLITKCYKHASITNSKTHTLLQHPVPILTPAQKAAKEALKNKPPTLHLTKAERKRHRKLRRAERLREQQDLQAAGLIPPPEPRLTLSNYMKVLGDQAVLDPSKMEAVVMSQIQRRKLKHEQMNADRKLTKEQKSAKHARKLAEDTTESVNVALFYVKDMSHPYHRAKVDLNAQQNGITGGVLECDENVVHHDGDDDDGGGGGVALVVAEGGEKAIKRYTRLMTVRMKWKGEDFYEEEEDSEPEEEELMVGEDEELDEHGEPIIGKKKREKRKKFNPNNECELIWSGMAVKRAFHTFMFQNADSSNVARKILEAKGVPHYWDLCVGHLERKNGGGVMGDGGNDNGEEVIKFRLG